MIENETLTAQEGETAISARYDLASGYPQIYMPAYLRDLCSDHALNSAALSIRPGWTTVLQRETNERLEAALVRFLRLPAGSYQHAGVTFSGGIALDRALAAASSLASDFPGSGQIHIITTSPAIDIMALMLVERPHLSVKFVESKFGGLGGLNRDALLTQIERSRKSAGHGRIVVLLTSPENPTGEVWSSVDLAAIGNSCREAGGTVIVDHSFLLAGVHPPYSVPTAWSALASDVEWIALWDTGKTFGLNEDKLGFVICSSARITTHVKRSLSTLQYDVSRRLKLLFTELLNEATNNGYLETLSMICRTNLRTAHDLSIDGPLEIRQPPAGSLALAETTQDDTAVRKKLMSRGVGVVAGHVFFHTAWRPRNTVRLALAREPDLFSTAFAHLVDELT